MRRYPVQLLSVCTQRPEIGEVCTSNVGTYIPIHYICHDTQDCKTGKQFIKGCFELHYLVGILNENHDLEMCTCTFVKNLGYMPNMDYVEIDLVVIF